MLTSMQLGEYFSDLSDKRLQSAIALVHSRFSTNTFPSWDLAQPFRMLGHNGEINTIKGNRLWMAARESILKSDKLGDLSKIYPIIEPGKSDSASLDNVLEFLIMSGKSLPYAMSILIPESFNAKNPISPELRASTSIIPLSWNRGTDPPHSYFQTGDISGECLTGMVSGLQDMSSQPMTLL